MCIDCCKEFGGWCKSFTKTELLLSILQALLLVIFFICLTFLILHLHVCFKLKKQDALNVTTPHPYKGATKGNNQSTHYEDDYDQSTQYQVDSGQFPQYTNYSGKDHIHAQSSMTPRTQKKPGTTKLCSWTPSHKTEAVTRYYDTQGTTSIKNTSVISSKNINATDGFSQDGVITEYYDDVLSHEEFDSAEADDETKSLILALVKITNTKDIMFGCTLTIISEYWTLTAASCIEAVEEVDALDSFVMLAGLGEEWQGTVHAVSDVVIHPQYQGTNYSFDLTALKSEDRLIQNGQVILGVATMADYLSIPIGERLTILGYGKYRSFNQETWSRRAHAMSVYTLPWQQCAAKEGGEGDVWSTRHLAGGHAVAEGECGATGGSRLGCAGVLHARDIACSYCGGSPVTRARTLVGVSGARGCGVSCAPAAFVSLAPHAPWLQSLTNAQ